MEAKRVAFWTLTNVGNGVEREWRPVSARTRVLTCKIYSDLEASEFRLEFSLAIVDASQRYV